MGEELIAAWLTADKGKELDWTAGREKLMSLRMSRIEECLNEAALGEDDEESALETATWLLERLEETLTVEYDRFLLQFDVGEKTVYFGGGSSYGDDPCVAFTAISDALCLPEVLHAVGFDVALPDTEPEVPVNVTAPQHEPDWDDDPPITAISDGDGDPRAD